MYGRILYLKSPIGMARGFVFPCAVVDLDLPEAFARQVICEIVEFCTTADVRFGSNSVVKPFGGQVCFTPANRHRQTNLTREGTS